MSGVEAGSSGESSEPDNQKSFVRFFQELDEARKDQPVREEREREAITPEVKRKRPPGLDSLVSRQTRSATKESGASHVSLPNVVRRRPKESVLQKLQRRKDGQRDKMSSTEEVPRVNREAEERERAAQETIESQ